MSRPTAIVTGATKGLGRATALAFAHAGHRVVGLYLADDASAETLRNELAAISPDSCVLKHDVTVASSSPWDQPAMQQAGPLVLVNNACAPFTPRPFHLLQWEDFEMGLNVALRGSWLYSRALLRPMLRAGRGTIVNVLTSAVHGTPPKGFAAYGSAKHALRGLTLALASEYSSRGLRVFSVSPGYMETALTATWDHRLREAICAKNGASNPDTIARTIVQLTISVSTPGKGEDYQV